MQSLDIIKKAQTAIYNNSDMLLQFLPPLTSIFAWFISTQTESPTPIWSIIALILIGIAFAKHRTSYLRILAVSLWFSFAALIIPYTRAQIITLDLPMAATAAAIRLLEIFPVIIIIALVIRDPNLIPSLSLKSKHQNGESLYLFRDKKTGKQVAIPPTDRYLNTIIIGPIGSGKSSRMLAPIIWQELCAIKKSLDAGVPRGITILEPKGDLVEKTAKMCRDLDLPYVYIDPLAINTGKFNPLEGDPMLVAEATRTVLRSLAGRQEAFFALSQEIAARNTILLLKYIRGDNVSLPDVSQALRDPSSLKKEINSLKSEIAKLSVDTRRLQEDMAALDSESPRINTYRFLIEKNYAINSVRQNVVDYFENEVFGTLKEKTYQFVTGLRLQFDDLAGNELLFRVISPRIDVDGNPDYASDISLDRHLQNGGVLLVNTASNNLGRVGDAFGRYVLQHLQGAVFRRPGNEDTRPRHTTIIDELSLYVAPDFERMLSNGRSYRNENIVALQSTSQLILDERKAFRETIMNLCRNKIFFGGMDGEDAKYISRELGDSPSIQKTYTYGSGFLARIMGHEKVSESERDQSRFAPTALMELPPYHVAYKIVCDNRPQPPSIGVTDLCPWDKLQSASRRKSCKNNKSNQSEVPSDIEALLRIQAEIIRQSRYIPSPDDSPTMQTDPTQEQTPIATEPATQSVPAQEPSKRQKQKNKQDAQQLSLVDPPAKDIPDQQF